MKLIRFPDGNYVNVNHIVAIEYWKSADTTRVFVVDSPFASAIILNGDRRDEIAVALAPDQRDRILI